MNVGDKFRLSATLKILEEFKFIVSKMLQTFFSLKSLGGLGLKHFSLFLQGCS